MNALFENISETDTWKALNNGGWTIRRIEGDVQLQSLTDVKRTISVKRVEVPEFGTYKVDVEIVSDENCEDITDMTLFAGRRNIVEQNITIAAGQKYQNSFYVAVTPYIPALASHRYDDKAFYVSFTHADCIKDVQISIERENVPVIWVAGDSTLTDQNAGIPYYPLGSCAGWAQTLLRFTDKAAVCNLAHSGMTTNCFRDDGHFDIAKEMIKKGDLFIIQFGHNDQKRRNLQPFGGYKSNIESYVREVRSLGAIPVICSPISRNGGEVSLLQPYAKACQEVAKELNVAFIDLHEYTYPKWLEFGDSAKEYFIPGDITHTNEYGAVMIADFFALELLEKYSENEASKLFDTEKVNKTKEFIPDESEKELPKESPGADIFSIEPPFADIKDIPDYEGIKKAFRYGLLDPCVMYLHPNAVMPRAQLLMVLFKAFRLAGKRPYEGYFKDISSFDWDAGYVQKLIEENLIDEDTLGHGEDKSELLFRPDEPLKYAEFMSFIIRFLEKDKEKRKSITLEKAMKKAYELNILGQKDFVKESLCDYRKTKSSISNEKYEIAIGTNISRAEVYACLARFIDILGAQKTELPSDVEIHPVH